MASLNHGRLVELAIKGLESERQKIDQEIEMFRSEISEKQEPAEDREQSTRRSMNKELAALHVSAGNPGVRRRGAHLSTAGRLAISAAMKARWAKKKAAAKRGKHIPL